MEFTLSKMTGVICFPSFHTVMALGYAYSLRRTGIIGHTVGVANIVMLLGVPFIGGHYVIDMIAGAAIFVLAALGVRYTLARRMGASEDAFKDAMLPTPAPAQEMA
jgi:membrane-associated phospholipid phosphatase